jgi:hypothetical protein
MKTILISSCILWYLFGVMSFAYWWTKEFDLRVKDILPCLVLGFCGFFAWIIGWGIHGKPLFKSSSKVILKKRNF